MASTRNKNTYINYVQEQRQFQDNQQYCLYPNSSGGYAYSLNLPGNGFGNAAIPGDQLSYNSIDIESFLHGTNLTNLTVNQGRPPILTPDLKSISPVNIYQKPTVILPPPLIVQPNRPYPI